MILDFNAELKNLCNKRVTIVSLIVAALGTTPKSLQKRLDEKEI